MKQPQLGKKILELRLIKGLTQTELAEKCNLSLRTIQRIESTEVTPRSYTLKLIFKSLDFDGFSSTNNNSFVNSKDSFNFKKNAVRNILLLLIISIVSIAIFKFNSKNKTQSATEVKEIIQKNQTNIKRWINNKQVDSVLTQFSDNACVLNSICGKVRIRKIMDDNIDKGYEIINYNIIAISVSDTIAVEKYENIYTYKEKTHKQIGIMEWHFINEKWLIVNDMFRDN
ncbi:helix-turn-helix transcriptional regulator [uncultured Aquimarina sp.]|uniref:helix-turn-helix domain-containing protein n=1 Tax=uncultured Aquimarina sp. TaxID=575652 RepID=UPI00261C8495|nr:helix-turn-helix transcriptional regulator [uncultured Aquimarina sp.]